MAESPMIDPESFGAVLIEKLPLELDFVRCLDWYDGPIYSLFVEEKTGQPYVEAWCDCILTKASRWLIFAIEGEPDMKEQWRPQIKGNEVYLIEYTTDEPEKTWLCQKDKVPTEYLP